MPVLVSGAAEGITDETVLRRVVQHVGADVARVYGGNGKRSLRRSINGYNEAARYWPWVVLIDLDHDADCAPTLCREWLAAPAPMMYFRVAVREIEAWLLADREAISRFISVQVSRVPLAPDGLDDPKETLINLARVSRRRDIRADMVPRPGSGRSVGPAYSSRLIEFVSTGRWRPDIAAANSESLRRCVSALSRMVATFTEGQGLG